MPIVIQIPTAEEIRDAHNSAEVRDLDDLLAELEIAGRQVEAAVSCALAHAIDESAWAHDGHRSAIGWVTSTMGVSRSRAIARVRAARFTDLDLHLWAAAVSSAQLGVEQAWALAKVSANPRVRNHLPGAEQMLLSFAQSMPFKDFVAALAHWERLADHDGTLRDHEASDTRRSFSMAFAGTEFHFKGSCGATQGAVIHQILSQFIDAEFRLDLANAQAESESKAESSTESGAVPEFPQGRLARTAGQRALDALVTALSHGASSPTNSMEPVVNLLCDATTLMEWLRFGIGGAHPLPDPNAENIRRCESMGGGAVDPRLMLEAALSGRVRTIITGNDQSPHVISRTGRFFDRNTRDAIRSLDLTCFWPGCDVPAAFCETDHLRPHAHGGATVAANAGPACRRHNRWKGDRWYAGRRRWGWAITRPDGTGFTDAPPMPPGAAVPPVP